MDKINLKAVAEFSEKFNKEIIELVKNGWVIKSSIHDTVSLTKGTLSCQVSIETHNECVTPTESMKVIFKNKPLHLYVRSMGKILKITALFNTEDGANNYVEKNKDEGVIAVFGDLVFVANVYDIGLKVVD